MSLEKPYTFCSTLGIYNTNYGSGYTFYKNAKGTKLITNRKEQRKRNQKNYKSDIPRPGRWPSSAHPGLSSSSHLLPPAPYGGRARPRRCQAGPASHAPPSRRSSVKATPADPLDILPLPFPYSSSRTPRGKST